MRYSLSKARKYLISAYKTYKRKEKKLSITAKEELKKALLALQEAILQKNKEKIPSLMENLAAISKTYMSKSPLEKFFEFLGAVAFALVVAVLVRQMWFELYTIPSGSMRPTFKEGDYLIVSKTDFAINVPLTVKHLYFDENLCKRNDVVIFTVENMDVRNPDYLYFYLFPGKKQFVKRLIGKPGDTLYFYGGKIYGLDEKGRDISQELQEKPFFVEHIPFIRFDGNLLLSSSTTPGVYSDAVFKQSGQSVAKLSLSKGGEVKGELLYPNQGKDYSDLWGFKNYATARILTKAELKAIWQIEPRSAGTLYLELRHHPSFEGAHMTRDIFGRFRPELGVSVSFIPLSDNNVKDIFAHIYTCRFCVKDGKAMRHDTTKYPYAVAMPGIPDGCYEFAGGKAFKVYIGGITAALPENHPLYEYSPEYVQKLFNLGIEFDERFAPLEGGQDLLPSRYAYFREGALYLMGAPIFSKDDPTLLDFVKGEKQKQTQILGYAPFVDFGAPLKTDGTLDSDFIKNYGFHIEQGCYFVLGDNHAMSGDSRDFGFVPEDNLRGSPSFILWPPGERWGRPNQPKSPFFTFPNVVIWGLALIAIGGGTFYYNRKYRLPLLK